MSEDLHNVTPAQATPQIPESEKPAYNRMADMMQLYHNHFRAEWNQMYSALSPDEKGSKKVSASQLVRIGLSFCGHLEMHHGIEEAHIFPVLAKRMPQFRKDSKSGPIQQHREMHAGLEKLNAYLTACRDGERSLRREEVKEICDSFREVLWTHLDDEIVELGWENMSKYWTKEEIQRMPM